MAYNFVAGDRDQLLLMPPSLAEWLPADHLAWFVLDMVSECDLAAFMAPYRPDGRGGAAYDPAMMVALRLYAYCVGERSSRVIERRCREDVAFRVIAANQLPDHATIARFRATHQVAFGDLFAQVLGVCARAGLIRAPLRGRIRIGAECPPRGRSSSKTGWIPPRAKKAGRHTSRKAFSSSRTRAFSPSCKAAFWVMFWRMFRYFAAAPALSPLSQSASASANSWVAAILDFV